MDHVAIMKKSWGLTEKILSGEKTIESRWYKSRYRPWDRIQKGDAVYFKNSGEPVKIKSKVKKVLQFSGMESSDVKRILNRYAKQDGISKDDIPKYFSFFKDKRYCILVFLDVPRKVVPFEIDKSGFGSMSAWLSVPKISEIKRK